MKAQAPHRDMKELDAKLRRWQKRHDTPAKVAAAHRKVAPGSRGTVHGVRERTGKYGTPEGPSEESEGKAERLSSTRYFETAEAILSSPVSKLLPDS